MSARVIERTVKVAQPTSSPIQEGNVKVSFFQRRRGRSCPPEQSLCGGSASCQPKSSLRGSAARSNNSHFPSKNVEIIAKAQFDQDYAGLQSSMSKGFCTPFCIPFNVRDEDAGGDAGVVQQGGVPDGKQVAHLQKNLQRLQGFCKSQNEELLKLRRERILQDSRMKQIVSEEEKEAALLEENTTLRRHLIELGSSIYQSSKGSSSSAITAAMAAQLTDANECIDRLKSQLHMLGRSAQATQDGVGRLLTSVGKGNQVFAVDPNDVTVQEAALDSLVVQAKRMATHGLEVIWSIVSSLKDMKDHLVEKLKLLINDPEMNKEVLIGEAESIQNSLSSHSNELFSLYQAYERLTTQIKELRGYAFDPSRNSPYCPCRPSRMVLEDDIQHLQRQVFEANEQLRKFRSEVLALQLNSFNKYIKPESAYDKQKQGASISFNNSWKYDENPLIKLLTSDATKLEANLDEILQKVNTLEENVQQLSEDASKEKQTRSLNQDFLTPPLYGFDSSEQIDSAALQLGQELLILLQTLNYRLKGNPLLEQAESNLFGLNAHMYNGNISSCEALEMMENSLNELEIEKFEGSLDSEDMKLLKKVDEQAKRLRRVNKEMRTLKATYGTLEEVRKKSQQPEEAGSTQEEGM